MYTPNAWVIEGFSFIVSEPQVVSQLLLKTVWYKNFQINDTFITTTWIAGIYRHIVKEAHNEERGPYSPRSNT